MPATYLGYRQGFPITRKANVSVDTNNIGDDNHTFGRRTYGVGRAKNKSGIALSPTPLPA